MGFFIRSPHDKTASEIDLHTQELDSQPLPRGDWSGNPETFYRRHSHLGGDMPPFHPWTRLSFEERAALWAAGHRPEGVVSTTESMADRLARIQRIQGSVAVPEVVGAPGGAVTMFDPELMKYGNAISPFSVQPSFAQAHLAMQRPLQDRYDSRYYDQPDAGDWLAMSLEDPWDDTFVGAEFATGSDACTARGFIGISPDHVQHVISRLQEQGATVFGTNPWDVDIGHHGVKLRGLYDTGSGILHIQVLEKNFYVLCSQVWAKIDPLVARVGGVAVGAPGTCASDPQANVRAAKDLLQTWLSRSPWVTSVDLTITSRGIPAVVVNVTEMGADTSRIPGEVCGVPVLVKATGPITTTSGPVPSAKEDLATFVRQQLKPRYAIATNRVAGDDAADPSVARCQHLLNELWNRRPGMPDYLRVDGVLGKTTCDLLRGFQQSCEVGGGDGVPTIDTLQMLENEVASKRALHMTGQATTPPPDWSGLGRGCPTGMWWDSLSGQCRPMDHAPSPLPPLQGAPPMGVHGEWDVAPSDDQSAQIAQIAEVIDVMCDEWLGEYGIVSIGDSYTSDGSAEVLVLVDGDTDMVRAMLPSSVGGLAVIVAESAAIEPQPEVEQVQVVGGEFAQLVIGCAP